ncbi:MAG TPA: tetratricopeptide repeat protein [Bryobacteraceae bacterium]
MFFRSLALFAAAALFSTQAQPATVLVVPFHNSSKFSDLNWVGESVSETLRSEFSSAHQIVFDRDSLSEAMRRLSIRSGADFTKATLIRLGQTLGADYVCYGGYEATLPSGDTQLKDSSVQLTAHYLDLRKLHQGPDLSEAGKLSDLSRLEQHLAWQSLKYLDPGTNRPLEDFLSPRKFTRVDAEESYIRGLLSTSQDQQQKWFAQALALDPRFVSPAFELGKLFLRRKDYRQALQWLGRVPDSDSRYPDARFKMGLSAYAAGEYSAAANYFRDVLKQFPMNEVYNNLGAAESQLNMPAAAGEFRHALDGDPNDSVYLFNLGAALLRAGSFDEAAKRLQGVLDRNADDQETQQLLDHARRREPTEPAGKPLASPRLKSDFDETAFRQLKAMLQPRE